MKQRFSTNPVEEKRNSHLLNLSKLEKYTSISTKIVNQTIKYDFGPFTKQEKIQSTGKTSKNSQEIRKMIYNDQIISFLNSENESNHEKVENLNLTKKKKIKKSRKKHEKAKLHFPPCKVKSFKTHKKHFSQIFGREFQTKKLKKSRFSFKSGKRRTETNKRNQKRGTDSVKK